MWIWARPSALWRCDLGGGCGSELVVRVRIGNHETRGKDSLVSCVFALELYFSSVAVARTSCIFSGVDMRDTESSCCMYHLLSRYLAASLSEFHILYYTV